MKTTDIKFLKIDDQRPTDQLTRDLYEANAEILYEQFYNYIKEQVDYFTTHEDLSRHHDMLNDFFIKFNGAFKRWRDYIDSSGAIPDYSEFILDLLYLGWWDSDYSNDPSGQLSPFGPWLALLGQALNGKRIGILHAFKQQITHPQKENLVKAQRLATDLYEHFLAFVDDNDIRDLKPDYEHPPLIQLYAGGAVTWLSDLPVPTIIAMDRAKASKFSGFSALPHEFGHDVSGTFKASALVKEIIEYVKNLHLQHSEFWQSWIEECFADAINVATIKEGAIFSLANLFTNYYTNIIFKDESGQRPDEHPNRHIRVLLTIEVGRILSIDETLLDRTEKEWIAFGKKKNTRHPSDKIYDQFNDTLYPMEEFMSGVKPVANALVNTAYSQIKEKKVMDIFSDFASEIANELRASITDKNWVDNR